MMKSKRWPATLLTLVVSVLLASTLTATPTWTTWSDTMSYATVADLMGREAHSDLAEVIAPDNREVTGELLATLVQGGDLATFGQSDIDQATSARDNLQAALNASSAKIDGYIRSRYGASLVSNPHPENADLLRALALDMTAYTLLGGDRDSERRKLHDAAIAMLKDISSGAVRLTSIENEDRQGSGARAQGEMPLFGRGNTW